LTGKDQTPLCQFLFEKTLHLSVLVEKRKLAGRAGGIAQAAKDQASFSARVTDGRGILVGSGGEREGKALGCGGQGKRGRGQSLSSRKVTSVRHERGAAEGKKPSRGARFGARVSFRLVGSLQKKPSRVRPKEKRKSTSAGTLTKGA